ncbi:MAG: xanthine dehydrogenase accessory protein XdhC [Gammaproteobacteria bacterium]|nr:xanthine dehydrogenase accessory protein XdhC [Gammaproteobacteria bacterium]
MNWLDALHQAHALGQACVTVTILDVRGSAPRGVGARLLVSEQGEFDTIGGGALEMQAIQRARQILNQKGHHPLIESETYTLASELSQCCGGKVTLQFDYSPANEFFVTIFGAGHVSQAVVTILSELRCQVSVCDDRSEWVSQIQSRESAKAQVSVCALDDNPYSIVEDARANTFFLVMTHSHDLDYTCVEAVLGRDDIAYCGLIASKSKAATFRSRLIKKGFTPQELQKLVAPIGQSVRTSNEPMAIAVASVADMLSIRQRQISQVQT